MHRAWHSLFRQVDGASLAVFRILFGVIMAWEAVRYFQYDRIHRNYVLPEFNFKYFGFGWVDPLPGAGMYGVFAALGVLALCIAAGAFYRVSAILFVGLFSYVFLIDQATYLNHFYLVILFGVLLVFMPANRLWSVDAWLWPALRSQTVPAWSVWTLRAEMEVMLLYAGIVKINWDWLHLKPLDMWLRQRPDLTLLGPLFQYDIGVAVAAYGSIALHVLGAPLLLWRRTRFWVFLAYCGFHLSNHFLFNIGIFPWFAIAASLLFFDPDWPRTFGRWLFGLRFPVASETAGAMARAASPGRQAVVVMLIAVWMSAQVLVPARHLLYPGNPSWTEEGHRFAWQMKLRNKRGKAQFTVRDPATGREWTVENRQFLTERQNRKMSGRPDMILQFAHHLADEWERRYGVSGAEVRVSAMVSLNGRSPQPLIDSTRDLAKTRRSLAHADWVLPLREPLRVATR